MRSPSRRRRPTGRRCCSTWAWPRRVRGSPTGPNTWSRPSTPPNAETASVVALVLEARAQRAQRFEEAVTVLDQRPRRRSPHRLGPCTGAGGRGCRRRAERPAGCAVGRPPSSACARARRGREPAAPPELVATARFISVLTNEPAERGAELAIRALRAGGRRHPSRDSAVVAFTTWFSQATLSLLWAEQYARCGRSSMRRSHRPGRQATAAGLPPAWLAAAGWRSGAADLIAAEGDARTALAAARARHQPCTTS